MEAMRKAMEEIWAELATSRATKEKIVRTNSALPLSPPPLSPPHNLCMSSPPNKTFVPPFETLNPTEKSGSGMSEEVMKAIEELRKRILTLNEYDLEYFQKNRSEPLHPNIVKEQFPTGFWVPRVESYSRESYPNDHIYKHVPISNGRPTCELLVGVLLISWRFQVVLEFGARQYNLFFRSVSEVLSSTCWAPSSKGKAQ